MVMVFITGQTVASIMVHGTLVSNTVRENTFYHLAKKNGVNGIMVKERNGSRVKNEILIEL